ELQLDLIEFDENTAGITPTSASELKRVARLIRGNPDRDFTIKVVMTGYKEDTVRSSPDLTEVRYDSTWTTVEVVDSASYLADDSVIQARDTLIVRQHFHNDRTRQQAEAVADHLEREGVPASRLDIEVLALPAEEKKVRVFLAV